MVGDSIPAKLVIEKLFFADDSWFGVLQTRAAQVRKRANVLHMLFEDQPGPGAERLHWEGGPCDLLEQN